MRTSIGRFASTSLAGVDMAVPDDLTTPTLLVFAYEQRQQRDVDTWLRVVGDDDRVGGLEVPVLGRRWRPARRFIDGGMASNMDRTTRERTMCVYTDVAGFRRDVLGVDDMRVLAALVDEVGTVHWHALGPADDDGATALLTAIDGLTAN